MIIAIDASRNRSGGAKRHLIELMNNIGPYLDHDDCIHLWSYKDLLDEICDYTWLRKHDSKFLREACYTSCIGSVIFCQRNSKITIVISC